MSRPPRGIALAELLVALVLAALLSAAAVAALAGAERHVRRALAESDDRRALREAEFILRSELGAASSDSLRFPGDTAVEFLALVGTSVACVVTGGAVVVPPATAVSGFPYSQWRAPADSGDLLVAFDSSRGGTWNAAVIDSVTARPDGAGCSPARGFLTVADSAARFPALRFRLRGAIPGSTAVGAPVRVLRRVRYVLLRGADRQWTLSYRRCSLDGACGASQPVVGPLASAADSGLSIAFDAAGGGIDVGLRSATLGPGLGTLARRLFIGMRNRTPGLP